jgi:hypothetical protein
MTVRYFYSNREMKLSSDGITYSTFSADKATRVAAAEKKGGRRVVVSVEHLKTPSGKRAKRFVVASRPPKEQEKD